MTKVRHSLEPIRHINGNIRAKPAPAEIHSAKEALEALRREREYRGMGASALAKSFKLGASMTKNTHYERYEKYDEVADAWGAVLEAWLHAQQN